MKRMISFLLAAVMAFMPCLQTHTVYGADTEAANSSSAAGQVDVSVVSALVLKKDVGFTVSLGTEQKEITLAKDQGGNYPARAETSFEHLGQGTYTLTVSAPGFADYRQEITVKDQAYRLTLMTGAVAGYNYEGSVHPGVIFIGDVNGDGTVDDSDRKQITDAVDAGRYDTAADLNGDGRTDLADLEYFTKSYKAAGAVRSTTETGIPAVKIEAAAGADTKTAGEGGGIRDILKNGSSVWLQRKDGKEISKTNPVSLDFTFQEGCGETGGIVIETGTGNLIQTAEVDIVDDTGVPSTVYIGDSDLSVRQYQADAAKVTRTGSGTVCIDLKSQVPVKRVTIRITGLSSSQTLAEISKVTFIGDMAERIPEPAADIPENLKAESGSASFTASWSPCVNVTGYEVWVAKQVNTDTREKQEKMEEVIQVAGNTLAVSSLLNKKLENYQKYEVRVRSVNGTWRSAYSEAVSVEPKPSSKPDAPDNVRAVGKYKAVSVSWKKVKEAVTYKLYYKKASDSSYTVTDQIEETSFTVSGLEDRTRYLFYVTGVNELGEGRPSLTVSAQTKDLELAKVPKYRMLNIAGSSTVSPHIISAQTGSGSMKDSIKDTGGRTAWGSVDNDPKSYYELNSWDSGGFNTLGKNGLIYEFDQAYKMKMIALQELTDQDISYGYAQVCYWDENGQTESLNRDQVSVQKKTDADGRVYYMLRLAKAITAKKIQIGLARSVASGTITVSEMYFYHYDPLEDDIMALYTDDLHTVLRSDVNQAVIDALRVRVNTREAASGEYHPDREMLERELKTAEDILYARLTEPVRIHSGITTKDADRGFGGLNAWQPLGVSAAAGEELTVYVGHNTKRTGEGTNLQLVATQYHSESSPMSQVIGTLKIGRNDITVPKIGSVDKEAGGALYVQYTGSSANDDYAVRVSGGAEVPVLDLYQVTDTSERTARIREYVSKLETYVKEMQTKHTALHEESGNQNVHYPYEAENCILGAADIMLDTMMLSLPAQQVLSGAGSSNGERVQKISESMYAMEDMMNLFYQHKGLNSSAKEEIDRFPSRHLNIRYQRMFAGAFMYASGNHIGIEYPQAAGMVSGSRVAADAEGRHISGQYFGWGIAHEIGHCINQGSYAVAEITNNYFSVLAQADETNSRVRFSYDEVYKKVTSNAKGRASNVFTQLGMYWQLHLAYDKGYNYKTYADHTQQLENLFFARVDAYSRTPENAPAPKNVALELSGDTDQNLMRLSCAAAKKDLLEFFERWGMTPDEGTKAYAGQFAKETRAICYANDEARIYQLTGSGQSALISQEGITGTAEAVADSVSCSVNAAAENQVDISLASKNIPAQDVLGYEIVRCTGYGDTRHREYAGFAAVNGNRADAQVKFEDRITTLNNRVVTYEVTVIDKYLGRSAVKTLAPVKIQHQGDIDKSGWTVSANGITATNVDKSVHADDENMCGVEEAFIQKAQQKAVDNDTQTAFTGVAGTDAEVVLEFGRSHVITGFRYTVQSGTPVEEYRICVRSVNGTWTEAASGKFAGSGAHEVWFAKESSSQDQTVNKNIAAYQADAFKLVIPNQSGTEISISELDIFGFAGDNIEFYQTAGTPAIGRLKTAFTYGEGESAVSISPGAIVFTGDYTGNAAYNVAVLRDQNGRIIAGKKGEVYVSDQLICADVPKTGMIQDVLDGTWIYWIDGDAVLDLDGVTEIHAELYRVDDAQTNQGERLVSDSLPLPVSVLHQMPEIEIKLQH